MRRGVRANREKLRGGNQPRRLYWDVGGVVAVALREGWNKRPIGALNSNTERMKANNILSKVCAEISHAPSGLE
jgi:hypothetical protein